MANLNLNNFNISAISARQLWLAGIFTFCGIFVLLFLFRAMSLGGLSGAGALLIFVAAIVWFILFNLTLLFLQKNLAYSSYGILILLAAILFGTRDFNIMGVILFGLTMLWAYKKATYDKKLFLEFKTFRISKRALSIFFTGLAIFLAFSYSSFVLQNIFEGEVSISSGTYDKIFVPVEIILDTVLPGYQKGMSIEELQQLSLQTFLPKVLFGDIKNNSLLTTSLLDKRIAQQSLKDFTRDWFNANIKTILEPYKGFLPIFFILGLFFVFKTFSIPFMWATLGFSWLVIKVLFLYNIVVINEANTKKQEVLF